MNEQATHWVFDAGKNEWAPEQNKKFKIFYPGSGNKIQPDRVCKILIAISRVV
jgi:hypothetical protein